MEPQYFAQVTDGIVTDVRKTTEEYMKENPNLYPGDWISITSIDKYPAVGWSWSIDMGFIEPVYTEE